MKLLKFIPINAQIELLSGLHIGAGNDEIRIGGIDNPVIKNPLTGEPYIPGSSLKGKMRSLLELTTNRVRADGKPYSGTSDDILCNLFGNGSTDKKYAGGSTRLIFSDCQLQNADLLKAKNALTEDKAENTINRSTGTAKDPRHMERVPAGAIFTFALTLKCFDTDNEEDMKAMITLGLKLLTIDCLGGSGSRGYGRIKFNNLQINNEPVDIDAINVEELINKFEFKPASR